MSAPRFKKTCPCTILSPTLLIFSDPCPSSRGSNQNLLPSFKTRSKLCNPWHFLLDQCDYKKKSLLTCQFWPRTWISSILAACKLIQAACKHALMQHANWATIISILFRVTSVHIYNHKVLFRKRLEFQNNHPLREHCQKTFFCHQRI